MPKSTAKHRSTTRTKKSSAAGRALRVAAMGAGVAGSYVGYALQSAFLGKEARAQKLKTAHARAGEKMRREMQELRGPAMKLGQTLSLHTGIIPEETLIELSKLQMEAPGMHPSLMRAQFSSSMGKMPEHFFREFDDKPFAAASLGQVHRATTRSGERVAVKIQYPGIREAIENDFKWFRAASRAAQATGHFPRAAIDEIQEQIVAETDYKREAANIEFFSVKLEPLRYVHVPRVFPEYSSDQVLTMSLLEGDPLSKVLSRRPSQKLRDTYGEHLFQLLYFQLLKVGAFHADPHVGNYLFRSDGGIGLVDFGCVKYLTDDIVDHFHEVFLFDGDRDSAKFRRLLEQRYERFGNRMRPAARKALVDFGQNFHSRVYPTDPKLEKLPFDFGKEAVLRQYLEESQKLFRVRGVMPEYIFLARVEMGLYDVLHRLKARVHTSQIVRRYLRR